MKRMTHEQFMEECRLKGGMNLDQCELLYANRGRRSVASLWDAMHSSLCSKTYWPRARVCIQDGGPNFWLTPKGAIWHVNYGWHSRSTEILSGQDNEGTDFLLNRGWVHVSGGRADYHCPLTTTQKRILEREYPEARMNPSYDWLSVKDSANPDLVKGRQQVIHWDSPFDYRPAAFAEAMAAKRQMEYDADPANLVTGFGQAVERVISTQVLASFPPELRQQMLSGKSNGA